MYFIGVYTVERFSQRHGFDRLGSDMRCSTGLLKPRKTTLYSALKIVNQRNVYLNKNTKSSECTCDKFIHVGFRMAKI